jgi:hypothetical protein
MAIIWRQRELDQLEAMAGDLPRIELFRYYRGWAKTNGLPYRTNTAIEATANRHGIPLLARGNVLTAHAVAEILGVPHIRVDRWLRRDLVPFRQYGPVRYLNRRALVAFARVEPHRFAGIDEARLNCLLENEELAAEIASTYSGRSSRLHPVECVETGRRFPSVSEAARATFISRSVIVRALRVKAATAAGYHWRGVAA